MSKVDASPAFLRRWLPPLVLACAFGALTAWSWGRWTDVHIDFGRELYLAWRLAEGDALYRDLAYRQGLLSPYWNALWFALLGPSLRLLVGVNLAILAGITWLVFRLFEHAAGRLAAAWAALVLLGVFAFSQYTGIANYNYVTPYHHQQTHGLALTLGMILARVRGRSALAGLCLGGVLLTKAELAVPALAAAAASFLWIRRDGAARFALAAAVPPAVALALLAARMPLEVAVRGVLGNFAHLGGDVWRDPFYARVMGSDDLAGNALAMWARFAGVAGFALAALALDRVSAPLQGRRVPAWLLGALAFGALVLWPRSVRWLELARALPLATAAGVALLLVARVRATGAAERERLGTLLVWAVWSLTLLGKILLHVRFGHYGFALAMPATLLLVVLLVAWLPQWMARAYGGGQVARALAVAVVAAGMVFGLRLSDRAYDRKTVRVGKGGDGLWAEGPRTGPRAVTVERARARLAELAGADSTLLVLPEGAGLNYWLRLRNPTRYSLFLPTEIQAFGADRILADLRRHPPDFVALVQRGHREFGVGPFGRDPRNGRELMRFVDDHYERVERIGAEPFADQGFGIVLLRRRTADSSAR